VSLLVTRSSFPDHEVNVGEHQVCAKKKPPGATPPAAQRRSSQRREERYQVGARSNRLPRPTEGGTGLASGGSRHQ